MIKTIINLYSYFIYMLVLLSMPHSWLSHDPTILKSYWAKLTAG